MKSRSYLRLPVAALLGLLVTVSAAPSALAAPVVNRATGEASGSLVNAAPAVAADGSFIGAAGAIAPNAWSALGGGGAAPFYGALTGHVYAIAVNGTDVYVGGNFAIPGIPAANNLAKWNGTAWSALPNGTGGAALNGPVNALLVNANFLYVGGEFSNAAGDAQADAVARWDLTGASWSDIAGLAAGDGAISGQVHALAMNGVNLYVGGYFLNAPVLSGFNPNPGDMLLRWDGSWHSVGQRPCCTDTNNGALQGPVRALLATPTGVIAGGLFTDAAGDTSIDYLGEYNINTGWTRVGNLTLNPGGYVRALAGSASNLYAGGDFTDVNGVTQQDYFVRWNGTIWSAPGASNGLSAVQDRIYAISVSGSNVYVGGNFVNAGGQTPQPTADRVAKWNGSAWSGLGSNGVNDGPLQGGAEPPGYVRALGLSTNALYVGGSFVNAANIPEADYVAAYGIGTATNQKPDGRIKLGGGAYAGNNIYNTTGVNQTRTGSAAAGSTITFTISIQNDGSQGGKFKVAASASGNVNYEVKYFRGTTEITSAVVAGTYVTASVPAGSLFNITAKAKALPAATSGSSSTRSITITSNANATKIDVVKLIAKRN